jgi:hypothetical protein
MPDAHFQPQPSSFGINEEQVAQAITRGELSLTKIFGYFLQNGADQLPGNILDSDTDGEILLKVADFEEKFPLTSIFKVPDLMRATADRIESAVKFFNKNF